MYLPNNMQLCYQSGNRTQSDLCINSEIQNVFVLFHSNSHCSAKRLRIVEELVNVDQHSDGHRWTFLPLLPLIPSLSLSPPSFPIWL